MLTSAALFTLMLIPAFSMLILSLLVGYFERKAV
jgi:hypothetical protein